MGDNTRESEHGQSTILELIDLIDSTLLGILAQTQGVEGEITRSPLTLAEGLDCRNGDDLQDTGPNSNIITLVHNLAECSINIEPNQIKTWSKAPEDTAASWAATGETA